MKKLLYILVALLAAVQLAFAAIDINTASESDLDKLPGVGPAKAKAIVEDRQKNGPFKSVEDLKRVKGIGDKTFDELKGQITVGGKGAAAAPKAPTKMAPVQPAAPAGKPAAAPMTPPAPAAAKPAGSSAVAPAPNGMMGTVPAPAGAKGGDAKKDVKPADKP